METEGSAQDRFQSAAQKWKSQRTSVDEAMEKAVDVMVDLKIQEDQNWKGLFKYTSDLLREIHTRHPQYVDYQPILAYMVAQVV